MTRLLTAGRARPRDVQTIASLLQQARPDCVPMTVDEIHQRLREFEVLRDGDTVVASGALRSLGDGRAELRALAVDPAWRGRGLGVKLLQRIAARALRDGTQLVCVTRRPGFFQRYGFQDIPLASLPPKPGVVDDPEWSPRVALALPRTLAYNLGHAVEAVS